MSYFNPSSTVDNLCHWDRYGMHCFQRRDHEGIHIDGIKLYAQQFQILSTPIMSGVVHLPTDKTKLARFDSDDGTFRCFVSQDVIIKQMDRQSPAGGQE